MLTEKIQFGGQILVNANNRESAGMVQREMKEIGQDPASGINRFLELSAEFQILYIIDKDSAEHLSGYPLWLDWTSDNYC
jgi:hypothetical protein